tara:strand:+ start:240 stop:1397 length:1158 start_codon:yes stop_codon:yes gene_type:complete
MILFQNILNYLAIIIILYFFYKNRKIDLILYFILSLTCLGPLVVNYIYPLSAMPDTIIYTVIAESIRKLDPDFINNNLARFTGTLPFTKEGYNYDPTYHAAAILAIMPVPFIANYASLGFANKFIYSLGFIYLFNKNVFRNISFTIFLFAPSVVFYTSLALKDTLVLISLCLSGYFLISKKHFLLLLSITLLLLIKWHIAIFIIIFFIFYKILFDLRNSVLKFLLLLTFLATIFYIFLLHQETLFYAVNEIRSTQWYADRQATPPTLISFNINLISEIISSLSRFFLRPFLLEAQNFVQVFQSIENIIMLIVLPSVFIISFKQNSYRAFFWIIFLLAFSLLYGITTSNFGSLSRWKFPLIVFYIVISMYDCSLNEKKIEKNSLHN